MLLIIFLKVASLIEPVISGPYFSYHGSLTTPGCNEVVHWINFKNTLSVSSRQVRQADNRQAVNITLFCFSWLSSDLSVM